MGEAWRVRKKNHSGAHEQRHSRIWQNIAEGKKCDNMEGKMREGKEMFNSKLMSFSHQLGKNLLDVCGSHLCCATTVMQS